MVDIEEQHLKIVKEVLADLLPDNTKVWIFGSRVTGKAKKFSDLDIALDLGSNKKICLALFADLKEAFDKSDLPWTVDIVDMNSISDEFKSIIDSQKIAFSW